jgi:hypothetical protein
VEQFLASQKGEIPVLGFLINLVLTVVLCWLLGQLYTRYGHAPSNRRAFARNFVMLGATTMVIITIVKSSLALSLGLVGALSIVRFRAAIKEPEELTYLFLCISLGLGFGADQVWISLIAFLVMAAIIVVKGTTKTREEVRHLHLTVSAADASGLTLAEIIDVLKKHCAGLTLTRFDEGHGQLEASFTADLEGYPALAEASAELRRINPGVRVSFLNYEELGS